MAAPYGKAVQRAFISSCLLSRMGWYPDEAKRHETRIDLECGSVELAVERIDAYEGPSDGVQIYKRPQA